MSVKFQAAIVIFIINYIKQLLRSVLLFETYFGQAKLIHSLLFMPAHVLGTA